MRYLLIALALVAMTAAFAGPDSATSNITLTNSKFGSVAVGDITATLSGGTGSIASSAVITVTANCPWSVSVPIAAIALDGPGTDTIDVIPGINASGTTTSSTIAATGSTPNVANTLNIAGSYDIDDDAGAYTGSVIVTLNL